MVDVEELERLLARATPINEGVKFEPTDYADERFVVSGKPCGLPIGTFGDVNDAAFFERLRFVLPALLSERQQLMERVETLKDSANVSVRAKARERQRAEAAEAQLEKAEALIVAIKDGMIDRREARAQCRAYFTDKDNVDG